MEKFIKEKNFQRIKVSPAIWQYVDSLLTPEDKAKIEQKFKDYNKWTSGKKYPTVNQVKELAKTIGVPYYYFLLDKPPRKKTLPYYRKGKLLKDPKFSTSLRKILNEISYRQNFLIDFLERVKAKTKKYVGSLSIHDDYKKAAKFIMQTLNFIPLWQFKTQNKELILQTLISQIEKAGIYVFFGSFVGNNTHLTFDKEEFFGLVLPDNLAPVIFINNRIYQNSKIFTLIHEVVHIFLGTKEVGGDFEDVEEKIDPIEKFCNMVAGEILMPEERLKEVFLREKGDVYKTAEKFKVSPLATAYKLFLHRLISLSEYKHFKNEYLQKIKELEAQRAQEESRYFSHPYHFKVKGFSKSFITAVMSAYKNDFITLRDVLKLFELNNPQKLDKFLEIVEANEIPF